uniref:Retrotransposon gag domain-containing protein n=1 Tax=Periophthalmus magnuspinnatus TaxID=409849 RepID=A0A3B4ARJ0_9GOBI
MAVCLSSCVLSPYLSAWSWEESLTPPACTWSASLQSPSPAAEYLRARQYTLEARLSACKRECSSLSLCILLPACLPLTGFLPLLRCLFSRSFLLLPLRAIAALLASSPPTPAAAAVGTAPLLRSPESRGTDPDPYSGHPGLFRGFMFQCTLLFQQCPARFDSDAAKIRYICGLLRGRALQWVEARLSNTAPDNLNYENFVTAFKLVFDHPHYQADAAARLFSLAKGRRPVAEYAILDASGGGRQRTDWTDSAKSPRGSPVPPDSISPLPIAPGPGTLSLTPSHGSSLTRRVR